MTKEQLERLAAVIRTGDMSALWELWRGLDRSQRTLPGWQIGSLPDVSALQQRLLVGMAEFFEDHNADAIAGVFLVYTPGSDRWMLQIYDPTDVDDELQLFSPELASEGHTPLWIPNSVYSKPHFVTAFTYNETSTPEWLRTWPDFACSCSGVSSEMLWEIRESLHPGTAFLTRDGLKQRISYNVAIYFYMYTEESIDEGDFVASGVELQYDNDPLDLIDIYQELENYDWSEWSSSLVEPGDWIRTDIFYNDDQELESFTAFIKRFDQSDISRQEILWLSHALDIYFPHRVPFGPAPFE